MLPPDVRLRHVLIDFWLVLTNALGWIGVTFILYGILAQFTGQRLPILEEIAEPISRTLTVAGTMLTAASIYFYDKKPKPPKRISMTVIAPIAIIACLVAIVASFYVHISAVIINGFAMVGLAGALFRIRGSD